MKIMYINFRSIHRIGPVLYNEVSGVLGMHSEQIADLSFDTTHTHATTLTLRKCISAMKTVVGCVVGSLNCNYILAAPTAKLHALVKSF